MVVGVVGWLLVSFSGIGLYGTDTDTGTDTIAIEQDYHTIVFSKDYFRTFGNEQDCHTIVFFKNYPYDW